jgi:hypothetical protein
MSVSSLLFGQLATLGVPLQYASSLSSIFTPDLITYAIRMALIGLVANWIRGRLSHYKHNVKKGALPQLSSPRVGG